MSTPIRPTVLITALNPMVLLAIIKKPYQKPVASYNHDGQEFVIFCIPQHIPAHDHPGNTKEYLKKLHKSVSDYAFTTSQDHVDPMQMVNIFALSNN